MYSTSVSRYLSMWHDPFTFKIWFLHSYALVNMTLLNCQMKYLDMYYLCLFSSFDMLKLLK